MSRTLFVRIRERFYIRRDILMCPDLSGIREPENPVAIIRPMTPADLDALRRRKRSKDVPDKKISLLESRIYADDYDAYVAVNRADNQIAGFFCAARTDCPLGSIGFTIPVPPDSVYLFDDYVFPECRGHSIHDDSIRYRMWTHRALGKERAFVCVYHSNTPSLRNYQKQGFLYQYSVASIPALRKNRVIRFPL